MAKTKLVPGDGDPRHGTINGYGNLKCRCDSCRDAWRLEYQRLRAERRLRLLADPTLAPHGSSSTYGNWGCRCSPCTTAWSSTNRAMKIRAKQRRQKRKAA